MNSNAAYGIGYLIVRVTTARGSIPLEGARVNIRDGAGTVSGESGDLLFSLVTNASGNTERVALPAPPRSDSVTPGNTKPYASYHLEVFMEGYYTHQYLGIPIFEGITAIQPADMIPRSEDGAIGTADPDEDLYFRTTESQNRL